MATCGGASEADGYISMWGIIGGLVIIIMPIMDAMKKKPASAKASA